MGVAGAASAAAGASTAGSAKAGKGKRGWSKGKQPSSSSAGASSAVAASADVTPPYDVNTATASQERHRLLRHWRTSVAFLKATRRLHSAVAALGSYGYNHSSKASNSDTRSNGDDAASATEGSKPVAKRGRRGSNSGSGSSASGSASNVDAAATASGSEAAAAGRGNVKRHEPWLLAFSQLANCCATPLPMGSSASSSAAAASSAGPAEDAAQAAISKSSNTSFIRAQRAVAERFKPFQAYLPLLAAAAGGSENSAAASSVGGDGASSPAHPRSEEAQALARAFAAAYQRVYVGFADSAPSSSSPSLGASASGSTALGGGSSKASGVRFNLIPDEDDDAAVSSSASASSGTHAFVPGPGAVPPTRPPLAVMVQQLEALHAAAEANLTTADALRLWCEGVIGQWEAALTPSVPVPMPRATPSPSAAIVSALSALMEEASQPASSLAAGAESVQPTPCVSPSKQGAVPSGTDNEAGVGSISGDASGIAALTSLALSPIAPDVTASPHHVSSQAIDADDGCDDVSSKTEDGKTAADVAASAEAARPVSDGVDGRRGEDGGDLAPVAEPSAPAPPAAPADATGGANGRRKRQSGSAGTAFAASAPVSAASAADDAAAADNDAAGRGESRRFTRRRSAGVNVSAAAAAPHDASVIVLDATMPAAVDSAAPAGDSCSAAASAAPADVAIRRGTKRGRNGSRGVTAAAAAAAAAGSGGESSATSSEELEHAPKASAVNSNSDSGSAASAPLSAALESHGYGAAVPARGKRAKGVMSSSSSAAAAPDVIVLDITMTDGDNGNGGGKNGGLISAPNTGAIASSRGGRGRWRVSIGANTTVKAHSVIAVETPVADAATPSTTGGTAAASAPPTGAAGSISVIAVEASPSSDEAAAPTTSTPHPLIALAAGGMIEATPFVGPGLAAAAAACGPGLEGYEPCRALPPARVPPLSLERTKAKSNKHQQQNDATSYSSATAAVVSSSSASVSSSAVAAAATSSSSNSTASGAMIKLLPLPRLRASLSSLSSCLVWPPPIAHLDLSMNKLHGDSGR